jgi:hypothetical protein
LDRWNNVSDACTAGNGCYILTGVSNGASGTYAGIIIKKETVASPTLDNFYAGDASSSEMFSMGIMRGIMRGVFK